MTTILEQLSSLAPYFATFNFQVLSIIYEKMGRPMFLLSL